VSDYGHGCVTGSKVCCCSTEFKDSGSAQVTTMV
jgi:hypothetical protein